MWCYRWYIISGAMLEVESPIRYQKSDILLPSVIALTLAIAPALGAWTEEILQDTLKSALISLFAICGLLALYWQTIHRKKSFAISFAIVPPLALLVHAASSTQWSQTYLAAVESVRWFMFILIVILVLNSRHPYTNRIIAWGIHIGAVTASLWAALQFWFDFSLFAQGPNPASTFTNRNFFAEYIVCTIPISFYLSFTARQRLTAFILGFTTSFTIVALLMTGTRSGLVALVAEIVFIPVLFAKYQRAKVNTIWNRNSICMLSGIVLSSIVLIGAAVTHNPKIIRESGHVSAIERSITRLATVANPEEYKSESISMRVALWKATILMALDNPILGVGAGAWEVEVPRYQSEHSLVEIDYYAHNEFLQLIAEFGLAGWFFLLITVLYFVRSVPLLLQKNEFNDQRLFTGMVLIALTALFIVSAVGFPWRLATTCAMFALFIGIIAKNQYVPSYPVSPSVSDRGLGFKFGKWGFPILITAIASLWFVVTYYALKSESYLVRAIQMSLDIKKSGHASNPRWDKSKTEIIDLAHNGIAINPHYRKLTPMIADLMSSWGDWKGAVSIWQTVLASRPHVFVLHANVIHGLMQLGDYSASQAALDRARMLTPNVMELDALQCVIWERTGNLRKAQSESLRLLEGGIADYDFIKFSYYLGMQQNDPQLTIAALKRRIALRPDEAFDGWLKLGLIYAAPLVHDEVHAAEAFEHAYNLASADAKDAVASAIPPSYRSRLAREPQNQGP